MERRGRRERLVGLAKGIDPQNLEDGSPSATWLTNTVGKQVGETDEGFPARGGAGESAIEAGIQN